ncbi:hypothetical protein H4W80_001045 [Nonomuraea angiospora]|uniref:Uncharacterized protein n=1 Tax=Nonomuraea angiospora TaxID=46172 RepID=A0ABR9LQ52_9ACTN|nr:hypothetical protein [Nonomuraea angiospora]
MHRNAIGKIRDLKNDLPEDSLQQLSDRIALAAPRS